jgi:multisubunit Na+/H+ antiporter MnhC subunit
VLLGGLGSRLAEDALGFGLLGHAANMLILAMAGSPVGKVAPLMPGIPGQLSAANAAGAVDPLPQALILTAIVIGFGLTAYLSVLLYRLFLDYRSTRISDVYASEAAEREAEDAQEEAHA